MPDSVEPVLVWGGERCTRRLNALWSEEYFIKDLRKIKRRGFKLERILIVDDTPAKVQRQYGNAIYVVPYCGETEDLELLWLADYLRSICSIENVRQLEKRGWRLKYLD
jgi:RNA polymerase II subunit A small phosphatase-like protein